MIIVITKIYASITSQDASGEKIQQTSICLPMNKFSRKEILSSKWTTHNKVTIYSSRVYIFQQIRQIFPFSKEIITTNKNLKESLCDGTNADSAIVARFLPLIRSDNQLRDVS